jgi:hypothetical protein
MMGADEERQQLELALSRMETHLLAALKQPSKEDRKPFDAVQTDRGSHLLQRFFNRAK